MSTVRPYLKFKTSSELIRPGLSGLLSNVGVELIWMGYTGQAANVLEQAKALIETGFSTSEESINWRPSYALYLLSIGSVDKRFGNIDRYSLEMTLKFVQCVLSF
jgi:hypothetical protein